MDEQELIQELQRFTTRFTDRIEQATDVLEHSPSQRVRDEGLRKTLGYMSSAIEIATGPHAEIDLLDMFVFVHLCRRVLDKQLQNNRFIAGDHLTLADFAVAAPLSYRDQVGLPLENRGGIARWLGEIEALPAWSRTTAMQVLPAAA